MARLLYRWVDFKAVRSYMRTGRMTARHCHFLPAVLSGLPHSRRVRGLSFGMEAGRWIRPDAPVCFVVDAERLPNRIVTIDGQAIYNLTQQFEYVEAMKFSALRGDHETLAQLRQAAVEDSRDHPDEAFIVGDVEDIASALVAIAAVEPPEDRAREIEVYAESMRVEALLGPRHDLLQTLRGLPEDAAWKQACRKNSSTSGYDCNEDGSHSTSVTTEDELEHEGNESTSPWP